MKTLPNGLEKSLIYYLSWSIAYCKMQDIITNYIESKNLDNETAKIKMIMNDLRCTKRLIETWKVKEAKSDLNFIKNLLLTIN